MALSWWWRLLGMAHIIGGALMVPFVFCILIYHLWCFGNRLKLRSSSRTLKTSKGILEYRWFGSGPVILYLHGTPGGADQGEVWLKVLQKKFSILAISRSGYGRTPLSVGRNLDDHADAIVELLDELDLGRVGVLALSGGGPLAMALARKHSNRIWAMLLVSAVSHRITPKEPAIPRFGKVVFSYVEGFFMWLCFVLLHILPKHMTRELIGEVTIPDNEGSVDTLVKEILARKQDEQLAILMKSSLPANERIKGLENDIRTFSRLSERPAMDTIQCPTLILHGTADMEVAFTHAEVASRIRDAEVYPVEGGSHYLWLGAEGQLVSRKMVAFLQKELHGAEELGTVSHMHHLEPSYKKKLAQRPWPKEKKG